jgi:hypothetical protein
MGSYPVHNVLVAVNGTDEARNAIISLEREGIESNDISLLVMNRYKKSIAGLLVDKNYAKRLSVYTTATLLMLIGENKAAPETFSSKKHEAPY